jgi:NADPH-dependent 2,4-dienoyl-CoA reductase/sulfur reductase-like enzyme
VTLFEKEEETGGQLRFASKAPFKGHYGAWASWLTIQAEKMGVILHTGTEVTESMISEGNPDVVILASGGEQVKPDIPGIDLPLVCNAWQVLGGCVRETCGSDWRRVDWHGNSRLFVPKRNAGHPG